LALRKRFSLRKPTNRAEVQSSLGAVSPGRDPSVTKARTLLVARPHAGCVSRRSCQVTQEAIPSVARFPRWKAPRSSETHVPSRGVPERGPRADGETCTSTGTGQPSRLALIGGDKRCSKQHRVGTSGRKLAEVEDQRVRARRFSQERGGTNSGKPKQLPTSLPWLGLSSVCAVLMSFGPTQKVSFEGASVSAEGIQVSSLDVGEKRVARCVTSGHETLPATAGASVTARKRNDARQRTSGQSPATGEDRARRMCPCVVLKIKLQKSRGLS
jgi:hypothetical protein